MGHIWPKEKEQAKEENIFIYAYSFRGWKKEWPMASKVDDKERQGGQNGFKNGSLEF